MCKLISLDKVLDIISADIDKPKMGVRSIYPILGCTDHLQGRWEGESAGILKNHLHQPVPELQLPPTTQPQAVCNLHLVCLL